MLDMCEIFCNICKFGKVLYIYLYYSESYQKSILENRLTREICKRIPNFEEK